MPEEIKRVISIDTKSSDKSINALKKDIEALSQSLNDLEIGTKEYNETLTLLGKKQSEFNKINQQIVRSSRTTAERFESIAKISSGLASGYGAATAAITLFGKESEDLNKVMVKLQSTIALVQGVGGLKDLIEELPALGNWFKKLIDFINPFNARLEETANRINSIDISKLSSPKEIPQGSTIAASGGWSNPANPQYSQNVQKSTTAISGYGQETVSLEKKLKELNIAQAIQKKGIEDLTILQAKHKGTIQGLNIAEGKLIDQLTAGTITQKQYNESVAKLTAQRMGEVKALNSVNDRLKIQTANQERLNSSINKTQQAIAKQAQAVGILDKAWAGLKNVLKLTGWIALATAIGIVVSKIFDYISSLKTAAKEQAEFRKSLNESTNQIASKSIGVFKELQIAYEKVGNSAAAKQQFIKQYADKIKETGLNITDLKTAEDAFINNSDRYVEALIKRAKAQATEQAAIKLYEEYLNKRTELEEKAANPQLSYGQSLNLQRLSFDEIIKVRDQFLEENRKSTLKEIDKLDKDTEKRLRDLFEDIADINKEYGGFFNVEVIKSNNEEVKKELEELENWLRKRRYEQDPSAELEDTYKRLLAIANKYNKSTEEIEKWHQEELAKIRDAARKKEEDKRKEAADKRWNDFQAELKRIRILSKTSNLEDPYQKTFQTNYTQGFAKTFGLGSNKEPYLFQYQSKEDVNKEYGSRVDFNNKLFESTKSRIERENELILQQLESKELTVDKEIELRQTYADNIEAINQAEAKKDKDNTQAFIDRQSKRQLALQSTLSVASSIAGSMSQIWGEETKVGKGFAVVQALIDTYAAANAAYKAMAGIPFVGPVLGATAASAAIAAGIANVKQILSVKTDGSISSTGVAVSAPAALNTPPVEYTRNLLGDKETDELNQPVKCYVVESEITSAQTKVAVTEANASF